MAADREVLDRVDGGRITGWEASDILQEHVEGNGLTISGRFSGRALRSGLDLTDGEAASTRPTTPARRRSECVRRGAAEPLTDRQTRARASDQHVRPGAGLMGRRPLVEVLLHGAATSASVLSSAWSSLAIR